MSYPDDILKAARAVLTAPKHATRPHTELLLRIAGAIADERKRCASIADNYAKEKLMHDEARLAAAYIRREIGAP